MSDRAIMKRTAKGGFTIVEMMVSVLVGAILALSIGSMLVFGYLAWSNDSATVRAQADASLAETVIAKQIRDSNINDISIGGMSFAHNDYATGSRLDFAANAVRSNSVSIYRDGDRLIRQPDGFVLVEKGLTDFTAQFNPEGPKVEIRLVVNNAQGGEATTIRTCVAPRN